MRGIALHSLHGGAAEPGINRAHLTRHYPLLHATEAIVSAFNPCWRAIPLYRPVKGRTG